MSNQAPLNTPWYKQFWPWFIIAFPMAAVIAGITTVYIANTDKPSMVVDDYYKEGKAINLELTKYQEAIAKKINITFSLNSDGSAFMTFTSGAPATPSVFTASFKHNTLEHKDFEVMLTADAQGGYNGELTGFEPGKWTVFIEPFDKLWKVKRTQYIEFDSQLTLDGKTR